MPFKWLNLYKIVYMKKWLMVLSFLSIYIIGFSQSSLSPTIKKFKDDTIVWKKDSLLSQNDFKGKGHGRSGAAGYTTSSIFIYTNEVNGQLVFEVQALFIKSKSFLVENSEYVLRHEQLHFDITELYARKLRKMVSDKDFRKVSNMQSVIQNMYSKIVEQWQKDEQRYDDETTHGINAARQKEWVDNIHAQLAAFDAYSSPEVNIVK